MTWTHLLTPPCCFSCAPQTNGQDDTDSQRQLPGQLKPGFSTFALRLISRTPNEHMNSQPERQTEGGGIEERVSFELVRYANCWEDADVLCEALRPTPGARILSIASAGDNSLALIAEGAEVVAADLSRAQLACLELRCAAFRHLEYEELLAFLGVRPSTDRLRTFKALAGDLSPKSRTYWNARQVEVETGIIYAGKFESYLKLFRTKILPFVHSHRTIQEVFEKKDLVNRRRFFKEKWNTLRWRLLCRVFFSRFVMGRVGRDPEFFRYVEDPVAGRVLARAEYAFTTLEPNLNPYLEFILTGAFTSQLPRYLRPEHFKPIRDGLDRLTLYHGPVDEAGRAHAQSGFDAFNLSNIFEYIDPPHCHQIYSRLLSTAKPRARLAYWNTFVLRRCPKELSDRIKPLTELAESLFSRDMAFFYNHFWVEEVV